MEKGVQNNALQCDNLCGKRVSYQHLFMDMCGYRKKNSYFFFMYTQDSESRSKPFVQVPMKPEGNIVSPETGVRGGCELSIMDAGNKI